MKIDFSKLGVLLLPTFIRHTKMAYFIEACIQPVKTMYNDLVAWNEEKKLEIATTCQAMYLEAYLNYKLLNTFNRTIVIADGDGITVDFKVVIPKTEKVDTYQVKAIVDKYKLIGKRYSILGGTLTYSATWQNFLSEIVLATNTGKWQNFLSEIVQGKKDNEINFDTVHVSSSRIAITASSTYPVTSDVVLNVRHDWEIHELFNDEDRDSQDSDVCYLTIYKGNSTSTTNYVTLYQPTNKSVILESVYRDGGGPGEDENFYYYYD